MSSFSILRGGLFIPVIMLGNYFFHLSGIIWSLAATEIICFCIGAVMVFLLKREIDEMRTSTAAPTFYDFDIRNVRAECE